MNDFPTGTADEYGAAIAFYTHAIEEHPDAIEPYWYLGLAWLLQGDEMAAQAIWFTALSQTAPEQLDRLTTNLAAILLAEASWQRQYRRPDQVSRLYQQVLELQPEAADIQLALGNALAEQGDLLGALIPWQMAATLQPDWGAPYERQAEVLHKLGQLEDAIACYSHALVLQPNRAELYQALGQCYVQQNQWAAAIAPFHRALQLQPRCAAAWGDLGYAQLRLGNLETAIASIQQAVQLQPSMIENYCTWIKLDPAQNTDQSDLQANANFLQWLLLPMDASMGTPMGNCYGTLGQLLSKRGQLELAIATYQIAVTRQPNAAQFQLELSQLLTQMHQLDAALNAYQTALNLTPNSPEAVLGMARVLAKSGQYQAAIAWANQAITLAPTTFDGYALLGDLARSIEQWDVAIGHYQAALAIEPTAIECWGNLAVACAHAHREIEAIACFKTILHLNSNLAPVVGDLMTALQHQTLLPSSDTLAHVTPIDPPSGWDETTEEWMNQSGLDAHHYSPIHPPQTVILTPPKQIETNLEAAPHFSFRFGHDITIPGTFVATLSNGRFWLDPDQSSTAILTENNQLLADLSPEFPILSPGHPDQLPEQHWTFRARKLPPPEQIDGTVAILAGLSNNVYFHWLLDCLPRFELLRLSGLDLSQVDYFLVSDRLSFQQESLRILGIPNTKILSLEAHLHIQAPKLIVPSFAGAIAWFQPWVADFLTTTFLDQSTYSRIYPSTHPTRLYISRQNATNRRIVNEAEIVEYLEQIGFVKIDLESLSITDQAQLFAQAEVIVAPHGSGLTNAIFCTPSTKLIEIFSSNFVYPCYWYISNLLKLDYFYLLGELPIGYSLHTLLYPNPRIEDIFVNLDTLKRLLNLAGVG